MQNIPEGNYPLTVGTGFTDTRATGGTTIPFRTRSGKGYHQFVRVSNFVTNAVGFVGEFLPNVGESGEPGEMHGTGFFVSIPSSVRGHYLYFVTARHVAEALSDREVCIIVNKIGGGTMEIKPAEPPLWFLHPTDKSCDVAVTPVIHTGDAYLLPVPVEELVTSDDIRQFDIGIGDEVFTTGLFSEIPNTTRNIPIVRHGNIAMMPGEQIQTEYGYADVCLIEARSIGGLSGSPVFVRPTANIPLQMAQINGFLALTDRVKLLGLMHGHWDVKESEINNPKLNHDRKRGVNYGIAIVTPAAKIVETLDYEPLKELRMKSDKELSKRNVPTMDSSKVSNVDQNQPLTQEAFETALKKASRKIAPNKK
jgi:hypothetical protein